MIIIGIVTVLPICHRQEAQALHMKLCFHSFIPLAPIVGGFLWMSEVSKPIQNTHKLSAIYIVIDVSVCLTFISPVGVSPFPKTLWRSCSVHVDRTGLTSAPSF